MTEDEELTAARYGWAIAGADLAGQADEQGRLMAAAWGHGRAVHDAALLVTSRVLNARTPVADVNWALRELWRPTVRSRDW